ncbi:MAG TPA: family 1 glycosylhydrolase [Bryobacteraceae bacterium]|nr:family 1 glycosylhydrolase [Bryobacteraceae bacterium]
MSTRFVREGQPVYLHYGAFESTKLGTSGTDILGTTHHIERWRSDLEMLDGAGIRHVRYSVPWHRIERKHDSFDFSWLDGPMKYMREQSITPVLDPVHHISFPDWLENGFANPEFPALYERFLRQVAERYPWADCYTVFNEPLPTTLFCSYTGWWYPHQASDRHFVSMALNVARSICRASAMLERHNSATRFYHMETCEAHRAVDKKCEEWAGFANVRRFVMHDLILGAVDREHPAYGYLTQNGASEDDLQWLRDHRTRIDVLGLDYYIQSEIEWYWDKDLGRANISWPVSNPVGFNSVAQEYASRFKVPVMLGETNLRGTPRDRLTWLKFMEEQCEQLAAKTDFRGFCWYPSIDSTDWCNFCNEATGTVDPQGIWSLGPDRWTRYPSELSAAYTRLANGLARSKDLPAWEFSAAAARNTSGYRRLMNHWPSWQSQPAESERSPKVAAG